MNIALLSMEWPPYGCGIGSYMYNLARGFASLGHPVTVVTHDQNPVACSGVRIVQVPLCDPRGTVWRRCQTKARQILWGIRHPWSWAARHVFDTLQEDESFDVVETAEFGAWGWHFLENRPAPLVVRCHNPAHIVWSVNQMESSSWPMPSGLQKQDCLEREQANRADALASPSDALAYHLSLSWTIPLSRFAVIPNPIDTELFCPGEERDREREILYVGRLEQNKGVFDLAQALGPVLDEHRDIRVRFVGMDRPAPTALSAKGRMASDVIRSFVPESFRERLLFASHVPLDDIVRFQQRAMFAVMPTRGFESFSYTVLEPMACGTPVIATRCGGPAEIVTHGEDGWLVPAGSVSALTDAMNQLAASHQDRERLAIAARRTAETRFANRVVLPKILEWYERAIDQHRRRRASK